MRGRCEARTVVVTCSRVRYPMNDCSWGKRLQCACGAGRVGTMRVVGQVHYERLQMRRGSGRCAMRGVGREYTVASITVHYLFILYSKNKKLIVISKMTFSRRYKNFFPTKKSFFAYCPKYLHCKKSLPSGKNHFGDYYRVFCTDEMCVQTRCAYRL